MTFTIKETEAYCAAFDQSYVGALSVYVDGSFDCDYGNERSSIPMGSGWSMVSNAGTLMGYGISALEMPVTKSAEQFELNSMVTFFEAMRESFPERVNRDFPVTVICDNQALISHLSASVISEESARVCQQRYGDYYARISPYIAEMDLNFEWVKGHDSNDFNRLADFLAKKAYQSVKFGGSFGFEERRQYGEYISNLLLDGKLPFNKKPEVLTFRQLRNKISTNGMDILTTLPTLWVGMEKTEHKGRTFAAFSFADTDLKEKGTSGGVFQGNPDDFYLSVRAINYALRNHSLPQQVSEPIVVRTDNSKAASLINTFRSGNKWRRLLEADPVLNDEVQKLKVFLENQPVIALEISDFAQYYKNHAGMMESKSHIAKAARTAVDTLIKVSA